MAIRNPIREPRRLPCRVGLFPRQAAALSSPFADPNSPSDVAAGLLAYLKDALGTPDLRYVQRPQPLDRGWETYTYHFQLHETQDLPAWFTRPLTLRVYTNGHGLPRVRHEFAFQQRLRQLQYPVPQPLLLEKSGDWFGGPFMVMEQIAGKTLYHAGFDRPWAIFGSGIRMGRLHAQLHNLPVEHGHRAASRFPAHQLEMLDAAIHKHHLRGLLPGFAWLVRHRPAPVATPSFLHLDFHPFNLMERPDRSLTAIDWSEATVGDPHADVATTLMLLECITVQPVGFRERMLQSIGRLMLRRWYLRTYRWLRPINNEKLVYYRGLAALTRLCRYGRWLDAGPESTGSKPSLLDHLTPEHVGTLEEYFGSWTGVRVVL